jgi:hypothetical protein
MELRALIIQACSEITEDMCRRVINNITVRVVEVARRNGGHIKHLIPTRFCTSVTSIVIEIKILLIDQMLESFHCHSVLSKYIIF